MNANCAYCTKLIAGDPKSFAEWPVLKYHPACFDRISLELLWIAQTSKLTP